MHYLLSKAEENIDEHVTMTNKILEPDSNGQQEVFTITFPSKLKYPEIIKEKQKVAWQAN